MSTDEESTIYGLLNTNWNEENIAKPTLAYKDDVSTYDVRVKPLVKIYFVGQSSDPHGLGSTSKDTEARLTIDIRSAKRDTMLALRDEIIRILDLKRTSPATGYNTLLHDGGLKQAGYTNFYHYTIDCFLKQIRKAVT